MDKEQDKVRYGERVGRETLTSFLWGYIDKADKGGLDGARELSTTMPVGQITPS